PQHPVGTRYPIRCGELWKRGEESGEREKDFHLSGCWLQARMENYPENSTPHHQVLLPPNGKMYRETPE
ncbi:MAG: hypothetical protein JXA46_05385, partial [Dehalococcoidales bacterium]|nr:hypothetical protein [Dehalococcoidales bacterium]